MSSETGYKNWYRRGTETYLCSTNPSLLDLNALNAALGSEMLWWATALSEEQLKKVVDTCLMIGLYVLKPESASQPDEEASRVMIGSARVITDHVTFGYLTDVYVLKEYQQKGLGTWMMDCLNEVVEPWPKLRGFWIFSSSDEGEKLYTKSLKAADFFATNPETHLKLLWKKGLGNKHMDDLN